MSYTTRGQVLARFYKVNDHLHKVYNMVYSEESSDIIDDQVHDTLLYQQDGMREELYQLLEQLKSTGKVDESDFKAVDAVHAYTKAVGLAMAACKNIPEAPFG